MQLLLVHDNLVTQKLFQRIGGRLECDVHVIGSGPAVLDYLAMAPTRPDIIFMKTSLPGISGYEVVRMIRTQPPFCNDPQLQMTPIIGLTASTVGTNLSRERASGYNDFLRSPLRINDVAKTIAHWSRRQIMGPTEVTPSQLKMWHRHHRGPRSRM
ncbi:response regulator [Aspergillus homomorphus CBS 101889]|uniref:Stress response regulator protein 1 n=1 Tax=Aspergillus homomorphus (strain CBS 101889) TaxID=1450537 RepID=A0A395HN88_ASPHC|nr:CheY-like protein [Aspergillus homomorphus CBS 101889]RAL09391.1 CheY-like protein [Aspergillus homomorphus CBS 101889]